MSNKFQNKKWYRQGGLIVPFFECPAMKAIATLVGHDNYVGVYHGERNHGYFNIEKFKEGAYLHIKKQLENINHVDTLYDEWKKSAVKMLDLVEKKADLNFVTEVNFDFWMKAWVIEYYDAWGESIVKEYLKLLDDQLAIVLAPDKLAVVQKEHLDLLKMESPAEHQKKYYFIKTSWADATEYSIEDIKKKLKDIEGKDVEIEKLENYEKDIKKKKSTIKLDDRQEKIAYFFKRLGEWRDERKVYVQKTNVYLQKHLMKMHEETGIPLNHLKFINIYDMNVDKDLLRKRHEECVDFMTEDGKWTLLVGAEAEEIIETVESGFKSDASEVKGMCASVGSIEGIAHVVLNSSQFDEFKNGEILVTVQTRPEFVPLMKKAAAIVTDEGGVTSHAAIVSRELGIPCVIGTQNATNVFKTGQKIKVDADNGIVSCIQD